MLGVFFLGLRLYFLVHRTASSPYRDRLRMEQKTAHLYDHNAPWDKEVLEGVLKEVLEEVFANVMLEVLQEVMKEVHVDVLEEIKEEIQEDVVFLILTLHWVRSSSLPLQSCLAALPPALELAPGLAGRDSFRRARRFRIREIVFSILAHPPLQCAVCSVQI